MGHNGLVAGQEPNPRVRPAGTDQGPDRPVGQPPNPGPPLGLQPFHGRFAGSEVMSTSRGPHHPWRDWTTQPTSVRCPTRLARRREGRDPSSA